MTIKLPEVMNTKLRSGQIIGRDVLILSIKHTIDIVNIPS